MASQLDRRRTDTKRFASNTQPLDEPLAISWILVITDTGFVFEFIDPSLLSLMRAVDTKVRQVQKKRFAFVPFDTVNRFYPSENQPIGSQRRLLT